MRGGNFCDAATMEDAPFPICFRHAQQVYVFMSQAALAEIRAPKYARDREEYKPEVATLYYVLIGKLVKIGYTINLRQRLAAYPLDRRLLATEDGTWEDEQRRHRHVNKLRAQRGAKPIGASALDI